ncbi:MAG TPA: efflux RND transporter periplasmic adaptor subunit [Bacteroidales bacterium]|mgnify:CR=1 FL=1|nr:efflux RND transporter periplasmic adaptor subunit [Bacteroidales bacterium]
MLLFFSMLIAIGAGCSGGENQTTLNEEEKTADLIILSHSQMASSGLMTGKVTDTLVNNYLNLSGYIDVPPSNRSLAGTYFAGRVAAIHVKTGQLLQKGDALISLENPEFISMQQEYLEARGREAVLKQDYERQQLLANENIASQKELQMVAANYSAAAALVSSLRAKLVLLQLDPKNLSPEKMQARIQLLATVSGLVAGVYVSNGQWLSPETVAVELVNPRDLQLRMQVFEKDLLQLVSGQQVIINLPGDPSTIAQGLISQISPQVNMEKRSAEVIARILMPLPEGLRPGMFVNAKVAVANQLVTCLPSAAIAEADERFYVLIKTSANTQGQSFRKVEVIPGVVSGKLTAVEFIEKPDPNADFLLNGVFQLIQNQE